VDGDGGGPGQENLQLPVGRNREVRLGQDLRGDPGGLEPGHGVPSLPPRKGETFHHFSSIVLPAQPCVGIPERGPDPPVVGEAHGQGFEQRSGRVERQLRSDPFAPKLVGPRSVYGLRQIDQLSLIHGFRSGVQNPKQPLRVSSP